MKLALNIKKTISIITILGALTLIGFGITKAFFTDTETSENNIVKAGKIDLKIDNHSYYNGQKSPSNSWELDDMDDHLFFNFNDLKPGDDGEDTISLHVKDNDSWMCMNINLTSDDDVDCTEPETKDDLTCQESNSDVSDGELASLINFVFWADDGDNVLESDEVLKIFKEGSADQVFDGQSVALADSANNIWGNVDPIAGGSTHYIGKAWCFGNLTKAPLSQDNKTNVGPDVRGSGITCDGSNLNNASQSDSARVDLSFSAVQSRHNLGYLCSGGNTSPTPSMSLSTSPTPTSSPVSCKADVMLVLDRSGSINNSELSMLKTAANSFVDSLGLSPTGNHAGQTSFATTGSLDQQLSDSGVPVKSAINALSSNGFTNLKSGIDLASFELASVRDRADATSPDKMVIITDGHPNRPLPSNTADNVAAASATTAKASGTEIFVVGVGSNADANYLKGLASGNNHYYSVLNYSGLNAALTALNVCN